VGGADLSIEPDGFVTLWVHVVRVQGDVGELPLQTLGLDLLQGCLPNEVCRLQGHKHNTHTLANEHWNMHLFTEDME